jgi:uncharacterized protein (DUF433 family)
LDLEIFVENNYAVGIMIIGPLITDFPYLEKADIETSLKYAARHAAHREIRLSK